MPLIYRAMLADGDRPKVGSSAMALGVRVPPDKHPDIAVGVHGMVEPQTGGMSVAPAWRLLPLHRIPRRLRAKFPRAAGKNESFLWRMGDGPFIEGPFSAHLFFRPDPEKPNKHGFLEPAVTMPADNYQAALAITRDQWEIDEE